jgi:hypothetical protein
LIIIVLEERDEVDVYENLNAFNCGCIIKTFKACLYYVDENNALIFKDKSNKTVLEMMCNFVIFNKR